ncbi:MAG TPA: glycosyl hydrolase family 28-related protein [Capsulimonadaceae bacterium]|jgi:hypothetical protein
MTHIEYNTVSVSDYGAVGDGIANDAPAIQRALDAGAGCVDVPAGVYRLGNAPLRIRSNTHLKLDAGAVIRLGDWAGNNPDVFLITNSDHEDGNENIAISGGVWDGSAGNNGGADRYDEGGYTRHGAVGYSGSAINFVGVRGLSISGLTIHNPTAFGIRMCKISGFTVEDIVFDNDVHLPNQDGVHINGFVEDGVIRRLRGVSPRTPNDDMVALNADDGLDCMLITGMVCGPIRRIRIEDIEAQDVYTFVRLLSTENVIEDIDIENIRGGVRVHAFNINSWRFPAGSGDIRRVRIRNVSVHKPDGSERHALVDVQTRITDMVIENFTRPADHSPASATLQIRNGLENDMDIDGAENQPFVNGDGFTIIQSGGFERLEIRGAK